MNVRSNKKAIKRQENENIMSDRCKLSNALNSSAFPAGFYSLQAKPADDADWQAKLYSAKARLRSIELQQSEQSQNLMVQNESEKETLAPMKLGNKAMVSMQYEVWVLRGIIDHKHSEDDLMAVAKRHEKIN